MTDETELRAWRRAAGISQEEMAERIGVALRAYIDLEKGVTAYRKVHRLAFERAALGVAVERKDPSLAPAPVLADAEALAYQVLADRAAGRA